MNKWLLLSGLLLLSILALAQQDYSISGKSIRELRFMEHNILPIETPTTVSAPVLTQLIQNKKGLPVLSHHILHPYKVDDLAFFCRLEVKIEKKLQMPFKFRLGEVHYTERMEGKY